MVVPVVVVPLVVVVSRVGVVVGPSVVVTLVVVKHWAKQYSGLAIYFSNIISGLGFMHSM